MDGYDSCESLIKVFLSFRSHSPFLTCAHLDGLRIEEDEAGGKGHRRQHTEDEVNPWRQYLTTIGNK